MHNDDANGECRYVTRCTVSVIHILRLHQSPQNTRNGGCRISEATECLSVPMQHRDMRVCTPIPWAGVPVYRRGVNSSLCISLFYLFKYFMCSRSSCASTNSIPSRIDRTRCSRNTTTQVNAQASSGDVGRDFSFVGMCVCVCLCANSVQMHKQRKIIIIFLITVRAVFVHYYPRRSHSNWRWRRKTMCECARKRGSEESLWQQ